MFYEQRCFPTGNDLSNKNLNNPAQENHQTVGFSNNNSYMCPPNSAAKSEAKANLLMRVALVSWLVFISAIVILFFCNSIVYWAIIGQMIFFMFMTHKYGGFEFFQIDYFNKFFRDRNDKKTN